MAVAHALGFHQMLFKPMGPFPLEDSFGMGPAVVMLHLSLQQGITDKTVKFNTIRKFWSTYSNVFHALASCLSGSTMVSGTQKMDITNCPSCHMVTGLQDLTKDVTKGWEILSSQIGP